MESKWFVMEEIENSHPFLSVDSKIECVDVYKFGIPKGTVNQMVVKGEGDTDQLCFIRSEFDLTAEAILKKILDDIDWALNLSKTIMLKADAFFKSSNLLRESDPKKLTNQQLGESIEKWAAERQQLHGFGMPWNYVEYENNLFSNYVTDFIAEKIRLNKLKLNPAEVFSILSKPLVQSFAQLEEKGLLELAILKNNKNISSSDFTKKLAEHQQKFCWLPYMYLGPAWNEKDFAERLNQLVSSFSVVEIENKLLEFSRQIEILKQEQDKLIKILELDNLQQKYVELIQSFVYTKAYRKDAIYFGFYCLDKYFAEAAKRLSLTRKQFRMLMSWEIKQALSAGSADEAELNDRFKYRVVHYNGKIKQIYSGVKARNYFTSLEFEKLDLGKVDSLIGNCACPGFAKGLVKIVNTVEDSQKMRLGDILVSRATSPDIVGAMRKAAAIVTDMGGITCHAAIVSRELNIPCVIGAKHATKLFKDGDLVEVDATKGTMRKL